MSRKIAATVIPNYPIVLLEELPRTQTTSSGLILTGDSNKPIHEGIVVAVWSTWEKLTNSSVEITPQIEAMAKDETCVEYAQTHPEEGLEEPDTECRVCAATLACRQIIQESQKRVTMECKLKVGDHVLYHHSAGYLRHPDDDKLVFVREGEIMGSMDPKLAQRQQWVESVMHAQLGEHISATAMSKLVDALEDNYILIPKHSVTSSGRSDEVANSL